MNSDFVDSIPYRCPDCVAAIISELTLFFNVSSACTTTCESWMCYFFGTHAVENSDVSYWKSKSYSCRIEVSIICLKRNNYTVV